MKLLIDGDLMLYRCGFAAEKRFYNLFYDEKFITRIKGASERRKYISKCVEEDHLKENLFAWELDKEIQPLSHAIQNFKTAITDIFECLNTDHYIMYFTGDGNYREQIATILPYKGNRSEEDKPAHYYELKDYLLGPKWNSFVVHGKEADDAVAIDQSVMQQTNMKSCIVSTDKDLDMIPGKHYDWVQKDLYDITELQGLKNFYTQLLTGDKVDNIPGIHGMGPVKAVKYLDDALQMVWPMASTLEYESCLWHAVKHLYEERTNYSYWDILEIGNLLWIQTMWRKTWQPPTT